MIDKDQVLGLTGELAALAAELISRFGPDRLPTIAQVQGLTAALSGAATMSRGAFAGGVLSPAAGFTTSRVAISPFFGRDSTNAVDIVIPTGMTKAINAIWAPGDGAGGRDVAGAFPSTSWFHVHAIRRDSDGLSDYLLSQSAASPVLPWAGKFRRIRGLLTDSSGLLYQFRQKPDGFIKKIPRGTEFTGLTGQSTSGTLRQLHVPRGVKVQPRCLFGSSGTVTAGTAWWSGYFDPDDGPVPTFGVPTQEGQIRAIAEARYLTQMSQNTWTDANGQVITAGSDASDVIALGTVGYLDVAHLEYGV